MLSLHDQSRGPWILLHVALDKGRFNMAVCGRYIHFICYIESEPTKLLSHPQRQKPRRAGSLKQINRCRKVLLQLTYKTKRFCIALYGAYG
jgi:hypothetical protein